MNKLCKETPEAKSWIYDILAKNGIIFPTVEGFSVREGKVTALFERLKSSIDVEEWSEMDISTWYKENDGIPSIYRCLLASELKVPFYVVLWRHNKERFRLLSMFAKNNGKEKLELKDTKLFQTSKEFALWMGKLKGIKVSKEFVEASRLSSIDNCLREYGVPWPGNLDGFFVDSDNGTVNSLFELRRTRVYSVKNHDLNNYFSQDFNGWKVLDIIRKQLNVPCYIITWSSEETRVKVQKLKRVAKTCLEFEKTIFLTNENIHTWFSKL